MDQEQSGGEEPEAKQSLFRDVARASGGGSELPFVGDKAGRWCFDARPRYRRENHDATRRGGVGTTCGRGGGLRRHGYSVLPKSACLGCPYHSNATWREMKQRRPDEWQGTVAFDRA